MHLKVLLPFGVFLDSHQVTRIVAETRGGSFGLLPRRLDCVAALSAGILTYEAQGARERYIAIDEGVLVKAGAEVLVSVRNAIAGVDLGGLRAAVEKEFLQVHERDRALHLTLAKLESDFIRRFIELQRA
jgi:F-type H+-transporting ATPase subunit epsilon